MHSVLNLTKYSSNKSKFQNSLVLYSSQLKKRGRVEGTEKSGQKHNYTYIKRDKNENDRDVSGKTEECIRRGNPGK